MTTTAVSRWRVLRGCQLLLAFPASKAQTVEAARAYARIKLGARWRETMDVEPVRNPVVPLRVVGSAALDPAGGARRSTGHHSRGARCR